MAATPFERPIADEGPTLPGRQGLVIVGLSTAIIGGLVLLSYFGFSALSTMRAYVHGEALWSRAQKTATYHLTRYALLRQEADYDRFLSALAIPLGDRRAREELERPAPDRAAAERALLEGGNHPDDVPGLATFFRRFRRVPFVDRAIAVWAQGDSLIAVLQAQGAALHAEQSAPTPDSARVAGILADVHQLDARLTDLEREFSDVMSEGARWTRGVAFALVAAAGALMLVLAVTVTCLAVRRLGRLEAAARASEDRYRALVETAADGIVMIDASGTIVFANPGAARIFGSPVAELVGRPVTALMPESERAAHEASLRDYLATGRRHISWDAVSLVGLRKDGTEVPVELSFAELARDGTRYFIGIIRDVTERKHLEAQLRQAQKMEAIGQLTGGVAHDFNNILTVVLTSTELLEREVPDPGPEVREELEQIRRAALRAKDMTRKLLAFSRAGQLQLQRTDLGALVREVAALLQRILPARISVACALGDPPAIRGDPGAIEQIVLNLATNARDAMPQGGLLRLETDEGRPADDPARPLGRPGPGRYARLTVRDTGAGMLPAVRERAFEPFFTTKPPGAGTGLGLSIVYGLMQQHAGLVDLETAPGQGTAVHLYFPAAPEAAAAPPSRPGPAAPAPRGAETILVVDDEPAICRAARRLLESYGYTVVEARDGVEGFRMYRAHAGEIALVLSDVVMPEMDGRALYDAVRTMGSAVPFLFMSGYTAAPEGSEGPLIDPDLPLLHKPWTAAELLHRVRAVLDAARGPTKR